MTKKELRELDAWIAEHVMGYLWLWRIHYGDPLKAIFKSAESASEYANDWQEVTESNNPKNRFAGWNSNVPFYTTDPAAAMEVLKKCLDFTWIGFGKKLTSENLYSLTDRMIIDSKSETLELAICLFAKKLFTK